MSDTRSGDARGKVTRGSALLVVVALTALACSSPPQLRVLSALRGALVRPRIRDAGLGGAVRVGDVRRGLRIGYISGGDSDPFVLLVTNGIRAAAPRRGRGALRVRQHFAAETRSPARARSRRNQLASMINWQFYPDSAAEICEAYGNLPTVAIDTPEKPCQKTFVGCG